MFGALVTLNTGTITVTADQTQPIEGRFRLTPTTNDHRHADAVHALRRVAARQGGCAGGAQRPLRARQFIDARRRDHRPAARPGREPSLLSGQLAGDTLDVFIGELAGDTLRGTYQKFGTKAVFLRAP